jgi:hypothetical protein
MRHRSSAWRKPRARADCGGENEDGSHWLVRVRLASRVISLAPCALAPALQNSEVKAAKQHLAQQRAAYLMMTNSSTRRSARSDTCRAVVVMTMRKPVFGRIYLAGFRVSASLQKKSS